MPSNWRDLAHCHGVDPEIFFPVSESGPSYDVQVAVAKAICAACPVREACLADALVGLPFGIAGGMTPAERRKLATPARKYQRRVELAVRSDKAPLTGQMTGVAPRAMVIRAGRAALAAGRPQRAVARECGVTLRTVERWAALNRQSGGAR
jgi:WhiB family redox-sensing transcriptional regulator